MTDYIGGPDAAMAASRESTGSSRSESDMKWEYMIAQTLAGEWTTMGLPNEVNDRFNALGRDGWELIGTESIVRSALMGGVATVVIVAFFKRPMAG
jgi:hypothetical protein